MDVKLYIATHKITKFPDLEGYQPIEVGRFFHDENVSGSIGDDTGDNISWKNENFCELTGKYWIWKNSLSTIVGLVHYRRYFIFKRKDEFFQGCSILTRNEIVKSLSKYDVILPRKTLIRKKKLYIHSVKKNYELDHHIKDWEAAREIIKTSHPDYYASFCEVESQKYMYCYNMMIARKEIFDDYCCWLFDVLFKLENKIDIKNYDSYQKRVFGFISERLLNVYFHKNKHLNVKTYPVSFIK